MSTRGGDLRTRRRALAVTHGIVGALREEYALLLPESLPFLSELLEDEDAGKLPPCYPRAYLDFFSCAY